MKRFKHKQTGHIATETHSEKNYKVSYPQNYTIPKWIIENSNDWEEVKGPIFGTSVMKKEDIRQVSYDLKLYVLKQKNYEILSFRGRITGDILKKNKDGTFSEKPEYSSCGLLGLLFGEYSVEDGLFEIYSIKRLSDGEIFTIGDNVYFQNSDIKGDVFIINNFLINRDGVLLARNGCDSYSICENILSINKYEKPILTTADGVDVFESKEKIKLYGVWINKSDKLNYDYFDKAEMQYSCDRGFPINRVDWLWFFDEKKADEYIEKHKPKISISDIEQAYTWDKTAPLYTQFIDNIKNIVGE